MQRPPQRDLAGVIRLRRELIADGYTDYQIARLAAAGVLHRVRHGAYVDADLWASLAEADRHRVLARAVLRTQHPSTTLTHVSAAIEMGAPTWNIALDEVHTTRTDGVSGRREAKVVHHAGLLSDDEVVIVNGVRVSPPSRCAVEVMSTAAPEESLVVVNGLLHAEWLTRDELVAAVHELKHWPHTLFAHVVLAMADGRMESAAESRTYFLCRQQGLPRPEPQVEVFDERGVLLGRVDFAWQEQGVFLEFDGQVKYDRFRRDGESLDEFLMREKKREEKICAVTGWVCIRISWSDLEQPARTAGRIRRLLESRTRPLGA